jgi:hypothetical protein
VGCEIKVLFIRLEMQTKYILKNKFMLSKKICLIGFKVDLRFKMEKNLDIHCHSIRSWNLE